jgi:hypothetical protein
MSIHRHQFPLSGERGRYDGYDTVRRCKRCGIVVGYGDRCDFCADRPSDHVDAPGEYIGRHHTEWVATIDQLVAQRDDDAAEFLLWRLIDAVESEVSLTGIPPLERHFTRLEQIARRRGDERLARKVHERYEVCRALADPPPERRAG